MTWAERNPERHRESVRASAARNPEKVRAKIERQNLLGRLKRGSVIKAPKELDVGRPRKTAFRVYRSIDSRVRTFGIDRQRWQTLLGCSLGFLLNHLELLMKPGMTWENYGAWHIDHIVPLIWFPIGDEEWQSVAFHWTNLQPLWAKENKVKASRYAA